MKRMLFRLLTIAYMSPVSIAAYGQDTGFTFSLSEINGHAFGGARGYYNAAYDSLGYLTYADTTFVQPINDSVFKLVEIFHSDTTYSIYRFNAARQLIDAVDSFVSSAASTTGHSVFRVSHYSFRPLHPDSSLLIDTVLYTSVCVTENGYEDKPTLDTLIICLPNSLLYRISGKDRYFDIPHYATPLHYRESKYSVVTNVDKRNRPVRRRIYYKRDGLSFEHRIRYTNDGMVLSFWIMNISTNKVWRIRELHYHRENIVESVDFDYAGKISSRTECDYNSRGMVVASRSFKDGRLTVRRLRRYEY